MTDHYILEISSKKQKKINNIAKMILDNFPNTKIKTSISLEVEEPIVKNEGGGKTLDRK